MPLSQRVPEGLPVPGEKGIEKIEIRNHRELRVHSQAAGHGEPAEGQGEDEHKHQRQPRVILMQNHGLITLGATWQAVLTSMLMAEKAARVFVGAAALGGPVFLTNANTMRIAGRPDEDYRRRELKM